MRLTLGEIVAALGGDLHGDASVQVAAIQPLESADASGITFLSDRRLLNRLPQCAAACVIVTPAMRDEALQRGACIVTADPYFYYARLTQLWRQRSGNVRAAGIHPTAVVHEGACVHETASIGPLCVVEEGAVIGAHTVLESRVTVAAGCRIGERCIIHPGAVIGADGFGFARHGGQWVKIEQLGAVSIGNDVEIGANTCIDRGALSDTVVEDGAKIDNLVQVAHNTHIGKGTAIAGCTGIAGSAKIGANCTIGGAGMIAGHLTIADDVHVGGGTLISRSIHKPGIYTGVFPFSETAKWEKNAAALRHLHDLRERVKVLEKTLQKAP